MPLLLRPREGLPADATLLGITADRLAGLDAAAAQRLEILLDGRPTPLGEIASAAGESGDGAIECLGDWSSLHGIGSGMRSGRLRIRGGVGHGAGATMEGGTIVIEGDASDRLGAGMTGGSILVEGNAGDAVAGALPGRASGMRGGIVLVQGSVGRSAGMRMRRGILAIGGDCGEGAGFEMRAGTVVVAGAFGPHAGLGMRRGSILALAAPPSLGYGFTRGATWRPPVLAMLLRRLATAGFVPAVKTDPAGRFWEQWHGDRLAGGRGEVFVAAA